MVGGWAAVARRLRETGALMAPRRGGAPQARANRVTDSPRPPIAVTAGPTRLSDRAGRLKS